MLKAKYVAKLHAMFVVFVCTCIHGGKKQRRQATEDAGDQLSGWHTLRPTVAAAETTHHPAPVTPQGLLINYALKIIYASHVLIQQPKLKLKFDHRLLRRSVR